MSVQVNLPRTWGWVVVLCRARRCEGSCVYGVSYYDIIWRVVGFLVASLCVLSKKKIVEHINITKFLF